MTNSVITAELGRELLEFLGDEEAFLGRVENSAMRFAEHQLGKPFANEFVEQLVGIQTDVGVRNVQRATLQRRLSTELLKTPAAIHLSTVKCTPEITEQLQERRRRVLDKAVSVSISLQAALGQLTESNSIVTAVLDAVLGATVDRSRYNSKGKPVAQVSHVEGQRIA